MSIDAIINKCVAYVAVAIAAGCAVEQPRSVDRSTLAPIGVEVSFAPRNKCKGISPEVRLSNVPAGVVGYEVKLTDLDAPRFRHWNQALVATAPTIPEGAGSGYYGPCPPSGTHRYTLAVTALDAQQQPVAYGEATVVTGR